MTPPSAVPPPSSPTSPSRPGGSTEAAARLADHVTAVPGVDPEAEERARQRLGGLAIPPGAAGGLGELAVRLAGATGRCPPSPPRTGVLVVAAGDHGVHAQGVTPWPQELSATLAGTLASGAGAAAVLASESGVRLQVLDVGLASPVPEQTGLVGSRVRGGTRDLTLQDAMSLEEMAKAVDAGARAVATAIDEGADGVLLGDVGLGNTTSSATLVAACTGRDAVAVTGRGSGIDDATLSRKREVVATALARHESQHGARADAWTILASLGGLEHAALVGVILAGAAARVPVVLDGVVSDAAALVAARACPAVVAHLVAGHRSTEPAARLALEDLGLDPLLDLDLRIGEGTGAVLAWPLLGQAAALLARTATLADLGVGPDAGP